VAVTVEESPSVVLDAEYRVVGMNAAARPWFEEHVGRVVFDCFPGSDGLFRPYYEEARATGSPVEFAQFYGGYLTHVVATPDGPDLVVEWTTIALIDTWTLDGLRASLDDALATLADRERRTSLRVVEGGG
jgi:hypothetical protein